MNYEAVLKQNNGFTVPQALFDDKFSAFEKSYSGDVDGNDAPAWRAFEIAYKRGELHGNTRPDNKSSRRSFRGRSKGGSDTGDDGSE
ncbi:hypothetical protein LCGC14_0773770 [marine sediment metagenome]|uniref:Uncharacterized protein n=1 Tax=marine sediment metagenome TaxID=412755 RepID=A0A0F9PXS3_9ZZZZ